MIHEIQPHQFSNHYMPGTQPADGNYILHYHENSLLWKVCGEEMHLPRKSELSELAENIEFIYLFSMDEEACYLALGNVQSENPSMVYKEIGIFRTMKQPELAWISIAGYHLMNWYIHNQFCGKCGAKNVHKNDERAMCCPVCKTLVYPRISPAIIVAIRCNEKLLLARNSNFPSAWYSLIAGYADVGESLEETVIREVKEEVGLDVWNIRYYKSQPWPLSGSMMIGFVAEAEEQQPICLDTNEITEASWFTRHNLPNHPPELSIAGEMIEKFRIGVL